MQKNKEDFKILRPEGFNINSIKSHRKIANNTRKKNGYFELNLCPICKFNKFSTYCYQFNIEIVQCHKCKLVFSKLHPVNFSDVYSNDLYLEVTEKNYLSKESNRIKIFGEPRLNFIRKYHKGFKTLLDIGAGTGWFLSYLKFKNIKGFAYEFSDPLREFLKNKRKIITYDNLEDIKVKFDVITLYDVIEHHDDPLKLLKKIKSILKPKGVVIIYTPNVNSLAFKYLGKFNNLLCPPQHLYYFSEESIKYLSELAKFKILDIVYAGLDIYDINSFFCDAKNIRTIDNSNLLMQFQNIIDESKFANHMRIVLKK